MSIESLVLEVEKNYINTDGSIKLYNLCNLIDFRHKVGYTVEHLAYYLFFKAKDILNMQDVNYFNLTKQQEELILKMMIKLSKLQAFQ
jgi:hypothetical protein